MNVSQVFDKCFTALLKKSFFSLKLENFVRRLQTKVCKRRPKGLRALRTSPLPCYKIQYGFVLSSPKLNSTAI